MEKKRYFLAIDLGASSGRHILGSLENGKIALKEIYRFENRLLRRSGHDVWDVEGLFSEVMAGLKVLAKTGIRPESIAIDTWGVDFILLDGGGNPVSDCVSYRDGRTAGMEKFVASVIPDEELYGRTGIQRLAINTIYQLAALGRHSPETLERAEHLLFVPEYLNFLLTGKISHEYTIASTSGLLDAAKRDWDCGIIDRLSLPRRIFGLLEEPGMAVGELRPEAAAQTGLRSKVVLAASHDTASAFLSVPDAAEDSVILSSGTWSLLGIELDSPVLTAQSMRSGFTNEGGACGKYRYLKNIMGLWVIQSVRRELNNVSYIRGKDVASRYAGRYQRGDFSYGQLEQMARSAAYDGYIDLSGEAFLSPPSMIDALVEACISKGLPVPSTTGELVLLAYRSLAATYHGAIGTLSSLAGRKFRHLDIVGGGSNDKFLNEMAEAYTGLKVRPGPKEATAIGNLMVQMVSAGIFPSIEEAKKAVGR